VVPGGSRVDSCADADRMKAAPTAAAAALRNKWRLFNMDILPSSSLFCNSLTRQRHRRRERIDLRAAASGTMRVAPGRAFRREGVECSDGRAQGATQADNKSTPRLPASTARAKRIGVIRTRLEIALLNVALHRTLHETYFIITMEHAAQPA